nr:zinc finger, CCHC-type [Tanacetum cinerariifolium]
VKGLALCLSNVISEDSDGGLNVEWATFPNEVTGASLIMPSPSGSKLLASEHDEIKTKFFVERAALERKYQKLYEPLYSKLISSRYVKINLITNYIKFSKCQSDEDLNQQLHLWRWSLMSRSYCHMGKLDKALSMLEKYEQLAPFETTTEEPSLYSAANVHELLQIKVKDIAQKKLKWVKVGGYIFFTEPCSHQSEDYKKKSDQEHICEPRFYTKIRHIAPNCPQRTKPNEQSNLVEEDLEPTLLMAILEDSNKEKHVKEVEAQKVSLHEEDVGYKVTNMDSLWYLDNEASNHMTGVREHFKELNEKVSGKVRFRDGSYIEIK